MSNLMSDAVMVPNLRDAAQAVVDRWDTPLWKDVEPTAHVIARLRDALAASTHVGGWQDISTAPKDGVTEAECLRIDQFPFALAMKVYRAIDFQRRAAPPPPSVSIDNGSRPQEAVPGQTVTFQSRVLPWLMECFGAEIAGNIEERCDRFLEEALEQVQSLDWPKERAHALVEYVYGRPKGEPHQEAGGVMVTFAALCQAAGLDMQAAGDDELARIMRPEIVLKIRAKQAAKPTGSALPIAADGCSSNEGAGGWIEWSGGGLRRGLRRGTQGGEGHE